MELDSTVSLERFFTNVQSLLKLIEEKPNDITLEELFGKIFEYYLLTNDKKTEYTLAQLQEEMKKVINSNVDVNQIIDSSYYFIAYNGAYDDSYRKYGLNNITGLDEEIKNAFQRLENALGKASEVSEEEGTFLIPNPITVMNHAIKFIPEKLWAGPLNEGDEIPEIQTPIKIGEAKTAYMMRIIKQKIGDLEISQKEKNQLIEDAEIVCEAFGSKRNKIAIIPKDQIGTYDTDPSGIRVFEKITSEKFDTITILDKFELLQLTAILAGANRGDYIDPNTGEKVDPEEVEERRAKEREEKAKEAETIKEAEIPVIEEDNIEDFASVTEENANVISQSEIEETDETHSLKDTENENYIFKPAISDDSQEELYRAYIQVAASQIQRLAQKETYVDCRLATINGMKGIVEPKIQIDEQKTEDIKIYYENGTHLDFNIVKQLMREYVIDYCLCNYDSSYVSFIVDMKGNVRGIDKEQAFKYVNDPQTENDYRLEYIPDTSSDSNQANLQSIYGKIFKDIEDRRIPRSVLMETLEAAEKIMAIPEEQYRRTFEKYAADVVEHIGGDKEQLLDKICKKRESLTIALEHIGLDKKLDKYSIKGKILEFRRLLNKSKK